uniref:Alpha-ribazole phosphatase n=1 Tax=Candidatus Kentrum eta TaxID=2126337 RepID=A0A450UWW8_9GAMM|nr:MAG: alpha-ribazole phosphatase [Candidatus Kentron sp. H]VFJ90373.1 MAG: alpha-ribazole phosphatase [Candidatus Kentron sp. H]VFJ97023.1 MAG: alpha-ribazole phosphatase [Candidatus Kentron sp. H]
MKRLLLIRHCETILGQGEEPGERRYIGRTDPPLGKAGVEAARGLPARVCPSLPRGEPTAVVSSPARRAVETARPIAREGGLPMERDPDLWEIDFGRWEGMRFPEIAARDPALVDEWARGLRGFRFPGGEGLWEFQERVARAGDRMRDRPEEWLVIVTHGGVIRFLLCHFLGLPYSSHLSFEVGMGSVTRLRLYEGGAVLTGLNG